MQKGYILGISCGYHDSAASLIKDGTVLGACEEERFTGIKHDSTFPINTIKWLMETYNVKPDTLDVICFYENPKNKNKFRFLLKNYGELQSLEVKDDHACRSLTSLMVSRNVFFEQLEVSNYLPLIDLHVLDFQFIYHQIDFQLGDDY